MKVEHFIEHLDSLRDGCMNRLADMEATESVGEYNCYAERQNDLTATIMSIQVEYYDDDE